ncbi:MAG: phosphatase PAP2 family protein, partial [Chloroflexi bacterium]|nr:phosphatase PAP2 family protein [Chloroflexota bacterium]
RPEDPLVYASGYSFPSGHATESTVAFGLLVFVLWRSARGTGVRRASVAGAGVVVLLIGTSRIGLGIHYPTDVLAGWLIGVAVVALVAGAAETWWPRPRAVT